MAAGNGVRLRKAHGGQESLQVFYIIWHFSPLPLPVILANFWNLLCFITIRFYIGKRFLRIFWDMFAKIAFCTNKFARQWPHSLFFIWLFRRHFVLRKVYTLLYLHKILVFVPNFTWLNLYQEKKSNSQKGTFLLLRQKPNLGSLRYLFPNQKNGKQCQLKNHFTLLRTVPVQTVAFGQIVVKLSLTAKTDT